PPRRNIAFTTAQAMTINGYEVARVVNQPPGNTAFYAIRANGRIYVLNTAIGGGGLDNAWLDRAAGTFTALVPRPFPTPTPAPVLSSRASAKQLRDKLADAFAARDADAVGRLMEPCHMRLGFSRLRHVTGRRVDPSRPLLV